MSVDPCGLGDAFGQRGGEQRLDVALVRHGVPASLLPASSSASSTPMMPLTTPWIAGLDRDPRGRTVAEGVVAGVHDEELGALADRAAQGGAGDGVVVDVAVAHHQDDARLFEDREHTAFVADLRRVARVGHRHARGAGLRLSTLLVPMAARNSFCAW